MQRVSSPLDPAGMSRDGSGAGRLRKPHGNEADIIYNRLTTPTSFATARNGLRMPAQAVELVVT